MTKGYKVNILQYTTNIAHTLLIVPFSKEKEKNGAIVRLLET